MMMIDYKEEHTNLNSCCPSREGMVEGMVGSLAKGTRVVRSIQKVVHNTRRVVAKMSWSLQLNDWTFFRLRALAPPNRKS